MSHSKEGGKGETDAWGCWSCVEGLWETGIQLESCGKRSFSNTREEDLRLYGERVLLDLDITMGDLNLRIPEQRHLDMMFIEHRRRLSFRRLSFNEWDECRPFMESDWPWDNPNSSSN